MGEMIAMKMVPVVAKDGEVIHVLDPTIEDWEPGEKGKALCGREATWYFSGVIMAEDRPCSRCEKKTNVAIVMFEADGVMKEMAQVRNQAQYDMWLHAGIMNGWVSEPGCYVHDQGPPLSDEEIEEFEQHGETSHCIFLVRLYGA